MLAGLGGAAVAAILAVPGASFVYEMGGGESCARCHEIAPNFETWQHSTHFEVACTECHGDAITVDPDFHFGNIRRLATHLSGELPKEIRLRARDLRPMVDNCKRCHEQEFRHWQSGAHSVSYAGIFATPTHNNKRLLMDDCMRCHGMHFPGAIGELVTPVSLQGPWRMRGMPADEPAIPCLSCHAMHVDASNAKAGYFRFAATGPDAATVKLRPSLALFDRRAQDHISAQLLTSPAIQDGGRPVKVNTAPQNALCYQCHAPYANLQAGTDDDKTPLGPYEGMACLDCHEKHTLKAGTPCPHFHEKPESCVDLIPPPLAPTRAALTKPSPR
ncbi:MAG: multiheme c-type cytochrome [Bryobacterales bacterium]|nr:multiheme c-type cytochrome [Bryobacterales bacterium]